MSRTFDALPRANSAPGSSLIPIEIDPTGIHVTQAISVTNLFGNVAVDTAFVANTTANNVTIDGRFDTDALFIANTYTPNGSGDVIGERKLWFDANYLYVTTANNVVKRVALSTF